MYIYIYILENINDTETNVPNHKLNHDGKSSQFLQMVSVILIKATQTQCYSQVHTFLGTQLKEPYKSFCNDNVLNIVEAVENC